MIPLAVELNEIPVVIAARYGISLDHHVGNSGKIEQHLAALIINITISRTFRKTSVCSRSITQASAMGVINMVVNPIEDVSGRSDIIFSPEA